MEYDTKNKPLWASLGIDDQGNISLKVPAKKSQHTPAPWEIGIDGIYAANNLKICTPLKAATHAIKADYSTATIEVGEREANARLIAAAPELLVALNEVLALMDVKALETSRYNYVRASFKKARAAIAKATGGQ